MADQQQPPPPVIEFDGKIVPWSQDSFTLGELEELEDYVGHSWGQTDWTSIRPWLFIAYLLKRRDDPAVTLDQVRAMQGTVLSVREATEEGGGDPPGGGEAGEAAPASPRKRGSGRGGSGAQ